MNPTDAMQATPGTALNDLLHTQSAGGSWRRWLLWTGALALMAGVGVFVLRPGEESAVANYRTEPAAVATLVVTVSATGNLQPTNQVEVGSELSGIVDKVFADVNDRVKQGKVLARLDLAKLQDAVARSEASLAVTDAQVLQAQATVAEARAELARFRRVAELSGGKVPSQSELGTAQANLTRAEATEASAQASVAQARANLQSAHTDLAKATIRSPIDGVVLSRNVDPGQTVAASFQAPVLFTLAEDLTKMELQVDVDEADVGQVQQGQKATFTVDAWPGRQYSAVITRVGYGAQEKDGVVSYSTVLRVGNDDLSLRPGMTATAEITTLTRAQALLVPNAALRFTPATSRAQSKTSNGGVIGALLPRPPAATPKVQETAQDGTPRVWVLREGQPVAVEVQTGATNGRMTEILGGSLQAGTAVIIETLEKGP